MTAFGQVIVRLHDRFCRPWTVVLGWAVFVALGIAQIVLAAFHGS